VIRPLAVAVLTTALCASAAHAQDIPAGRLEIAAGLNWLGHATLGASDATQTTSSGAPTTFFATSTVLDASAGPGLRIGVRAARRLEIAAVAAFNRPTLATTISGDVEATGSVTATERIKQYEIGGGLLFYLPVRHAVTQKPGLLPFVAGSIAYLRQLHESQTLAATGRAYQLGGGVKYLLGSRSRGLKSYGVRGDLAVEARTKGIAFDSRALYSPLLGVSFFARF